MLGKRQGATACHDISYPFSCKRTRCSANPYEASMPLGQSGYDICNINYEASGCSPVGFAWQGCSAAAADAALPNASQHCNYNVAQQQWLRSVQTSWKYCDGSSLAGLTHCEDMCDAAAQQQQPKLLSQLSSCSTQSPIVIGEAYFTDKQQHDPSVGTVNTSMSAQAAECSWISQQQFGTARVNCCISPCMAQHSSSSISPITFQLQQVSHAPSLSLLSEPTDAGHIHHKTHFASYQANYQLEVTNLCQMSEHARHTPASHCTMQYKTNSELGNTYITLLSNNNSCSHWEQEHATPMLTMAKSSGAQACYAPLMHNGYRQLQQQPDAYSNVAVQQQQQYTTWPRNCAATNVKQGVPLNASEFMSAAMRLLGFQEPTTLHLAIHCWNRIENAIEAWSASRGLGLAMAGCSTPDMLRATALVTLWTASKLEELRQKHAKSSVVAALLPPSLAPLGSRGVVVLETWVMKSLQWSPYSGFGF